MLMAMRTNNADILVHLLVALGLTYVLGFERELRGSSAGDRTFSLIGVGTALIGTLGAHGNRFVLGAAVTGIAFIGGGLTFRQATERGNVARGVPTAAAIFAAAAIGAVAGYGLLLPATVTTAVVLLVLEVDHIPGLRVLNGRRWTPRVAHDEPGESYAQDSADSAP
jgi:putative Mg2+ transporter-C (MgtC) family protein